jgi:protein-S-isoprenylcysteine O-methyltransferase Ste14
MSVEALFRFLFILSGIAMLAIRVYYQRKVRREGQETSVTGTPWHLIPGALAALISIGFGLAYILFPSSMPWSYYHPPAWLRWVGVLLLLVGIWLLQSAHHHLGKSFHSLVVRKADQLFVDSGPYRFVRHPIYTAYVLNYLGGGLLAASWVLTFLPCPLFMLMIALRLGEEERAMVEQFGEAYERYMERTARFLPPFPSR